MAPPRGRRHPRHGAREGTSHDVSCTARAAIDGPSSPTAPCPLRSGHDRARCSERPGGRGRAGGLRKPERIGDRQQRRCAARGHGRDHESRAQHRRYGRDQRVGHLRQGSAAARHVRSEGGARRLQDRRRSTGHGQRRYADTGQLQARSRGGDRRGDGERRRAAAQDRPRRRGDALRREGADRAARARSQLHQVHPADTGRAAPGLAARRVREPAGLDADPDQRAAFQRNGLSARRHRESRPDSRHHRHQPDARVDRREQGHVAKLRCGVRAGDRRGRLGADEVRLERFSRERVRVLPERGAPGAQSVHPVPTGSRDRQARPRLDAEPVRRLGRRPDRRRTSGSSSATIRAPVTTVADPS